MLYRKLGCMSVQCKVMFCDFIIDLIINERIEIIEICVKEFCFVVEKMIMFGKCGDFYVCC